MKEVTVSKQIDKQEIKNQKKKIKQTHEKRKKE
jgi:hypothetical protein